MTTLTETIKRLQDGKNLSEQDMMAAMTVIMDGQANEEDMADFLTLLAEKGETIDEITGAARILRGKASTIKAPEDALDCCGTGGDCSGTYNISSAVAFVAASCGVPVAKHGNRSASSKSGAADVLEALGINIDVPTEKLESALRDLNYCFLMAPAHHQAVRHVVPVRKKLGFRTIFNLLGPLANPADTKFQLMGVFDDKWLEPFAETLRRLGSKRAWIVHGHDGLDEITVTDKTRVAILDNGIVTSRDIAPEDFGIPRYSMEELKGGDAAENARALLSVLSGDASAYRDIVLINSAAVLNVHGTASSFEEGMAKARQNIDNGDAMAVLDKYRDYVGA